MTPRRGPGMLFHLAAACTAVFIVTVLAMVATLFGDPLSPANMWLNAYGTWLLIAEVAAIVITSCAAMGVDQWRSRRESATRAEDR